MAQANLKCERRGGLLRSIFSEAKRGAETEKKRFLDKVIECSKHRLKSIFTKENFITISRIQL